MVRHIILLAALFMLSSCLHVKDFGKYWDKGVFDACIADILKQDFEPDEIVKLDEPTLLWRVLDIGGYHFLMIKSEAGDAGGDMIRIDVADGKLVIYGLNPEMQDEFKSQYPDSSVVLNGNGVGVTATIPVFDDDTRAFIEKVAAEKKYWVEDKREAYNPTNRKDCVF